MRYKAEWNQMQESRKAAGLTNESNPPLFGKYVVALFSNFNDNYRMFMYAHPFNLKGIYEMYRWAKHYKLKFTLRIFNILNK